MYIYAYIIIYIYIYICISISTYLHTHIYIYTHTHTHIYIYIYIHMHTAVQNLSIYIQGHPLLSGCLPIKDRVSDFNVCSCYKQNRHDEQTSYQTRCISKHNRTHPHAFTYIQHHTHIPAHTHTPTHTRTHTHTPHAYRDRPDAQVVPFFHGSLSARLMLPLHLRALYKSQALCGIKAVQNKHHCKMIHQTTSIHPQHPATSH